MADYKYNLDEAIRRLGGDMKKSIEPFMGQIAFKVLADAYEVAAEETPVDTGYLRLSLTTGLNGDVAYIPPDPPEKREAGMFTGDWAEAQQASMAALADFRLGDRVQLGYTATYAPYVEDKFHMMKTVHSLMKRIVGGAVAAVKRGLV